MFGLPKAIKCWNLNQETSYANASLQVFIQLECVQNWIKQLLSTGNINNPFFNTTLTKDIYLLLDSLSNGMNLDSTKTILDFDVKTNYMWHKIIGKDPYHFFYYLLELLHLENNNPRNPFFNAMEYQQSIANNIHNDYQVFQLFNNYMQQTQNSFISYNFFNIQKYLVTCPICNNNFCYDIKKILVFNVNDMLNIRNKLYPLKFGSNLTLSDCFEISLFGKNNNCQMCFSNISNEMEKLYDCSNVLIIAFKRYQHSDNYRGDVNFGLDIDISKYIINQNSDNKIFKLKGVISRYRRDKYYADVFINQNYYRLMDTKDFNQKDVKMLKNVNQLMEFEPQLLIYEINYQTKLFFQMKKIESVKNLMQIMFLNFKFASLANQMQFVMNNNNNNCNNNNYPQGFILKFLCIPQIWDKKEESAIPISPQVLSDFTIQETINKFYQKLAKPREAILHFSFNNVILDVNSQQKLSDLNINQNSIIYAIKSPNFDQLELPPNNSY